MPPSESYAQHDERPHEDHRVVLSGVTWADYQRLLEVRGDKSAPRITYLEGVVELMSPSRSHQFIKSILGRLVEVFCLEVGIEFSTYGSWTLEDKEAERGAEPDECYVFGDVAAPDRPDLAIEVVWTSGRIDKLEVYRKLGVKEVWYWRKGEIHPYVLRAGQYKRVARSKALPALDLVELASFVEHVGTSRAIRAYRTALRKRLGKRR